jgi:hypothetical protein
MRYFVFVGSPEPHIKAEVSISDDDAAWMQAHPGSLNDDIPIRNDGDEPMTEEQLLASDPGRRALEAWRGGDESALEVAAARRLLQSATDTLESLVRFDGCREAAEILKAGMADPRYLHWGSQHVCRRNVCGGGRALAGVD